VQIDCAPSVELPLRARMLQVVAENLAENAIRYAGEGATCVLSCREEDDGGVLTYYEYSPDLSAAQFEDYKAKRPISFELEWNGTSGSVAFNVSEGRFQDGPFYFLIDNTARGVVRPRATASPPLPSAWRRSPSRRRRAPRPSRR